MITKRWLTIPSKLFKTTTNKEFDILFYAQHIKMLNYDDKIKAVYLSPINNNC